MNLTSRERGLLVFISVIIFIWAISLIFHLPSPESMVIVGVWGILIIILSSMYLIIILKPKNFSPKVVDIELHQEKINQELKKVDINPIGNLVTIIENIGFTDPTYTLKLHRWSYLRDKGKILLTDKELIFLGKKANFSIQLTEIEAIQPFILRGERITFKIFEMIYKEAQQKVSAIFMGLPGFTFDRFLEIEGKSLKLMELIQKWYDSWKNEFPVIN